MRSHYLLLLLVCAAVIVSCEGKRSQGVFKRKSDWKYLEKFCYSTDGDGWLHWDIKTKQPGHKLCYYDDEPTSWDLVYGSSLTCEEKVALSANLTKAGKKCQTIEPYNEETKQSAIGKIKFIDHQRAHYWFVAIVNCGGTIDMENFDLHFANPGGWWTAEFSFDEQGLISIFFVFFLALLCLCGAQGYSIYQYYKITGVHPMVKLLTSVVMLDLVATFFNFIHYAIYAGDGIGSPGLRFLGVMFDICSMLALLLLLVLIAKGWTITYPKITQPTLVLSILGGFAFLYLVMFVVDAAWADPASTDYIYDTAPGVLILFVRIGTLVWFLWSVYQTYNDEKHEEKKFFYRVFAIIYSLWFLALPILVLIALAINAWVRHKIVEGLYMTMTFLGDAFLVALLWPSRAGHYFKIVPEDVMGGMTPYDQI